MRLSNEMYILLDVEYCASAPRRYLPATVHTCTYSTYVLSALTRAGNNGMGGQSVYICVYRWMDGRMNGWMDGHDHIQEGIGRGQKERTRWSIFFFFSFFLVEYLYSTHTYHSLCTHACMHACTRERKGKTKKKKKKSGGDKVDRCGYWLKERRRVREKGSNERREKKKKRGYKLVHKFMEGKKKNS